MPQDDPITLADRGEQIVFPMPQSAQPDPDNGFVVPPDPADHVPMTVVDAKAYDDTQERKIEDAREKLGLEPHVESETDDSSDVVSDSNTETTDDSDTLDQNTEPTRRSWLSS